MKAVLQYRASPGLRQQISALNFPTAIVDEADKDTFRREMADADILLHVLEPVTAAVIDAASHLRLIQEIGIGVNTIDLDAASRRGIAVCNLPGTNTQAVAEMTLLRSGRPSQLPAGSADQNGRSVKKRSERLLLVRQCCRGRLAGVYGPGRTLRPQPTPGSRRASGLRTRGCRHRLRVRA
jgi:phosphoglycerate dehydrogenase-like enzyme